MLTILNSIFQLLISNNTVVAGLFSPQDSTKFTLVLCLECLSLALFCRKSLLFEKVLTTWLSWSFGVLGFYSPFVLPWDVLLWCLEMIFGMGWLVLNGFRLPLLTDPKPWRSNLSLQTTFYFNMLVCCVLFSSYLILQILRWIQFLHCISDAKKCAWHLTGWDWMLLRRIAKMQLAVVVCVLLLYHCNCFPSYLHEDKLPVDLKYVYSVVPICRIVLQLRISL